MSLQANGENGKSVCPRPKSGFGSEYGSKAITKAKQDCNKTFISICYRFYCCCCCSRAAVINLFCFEELEEKKFA